MIEECCGEGCLYSTLQILHLKPVESNGRDGTEARHHSLTQGEGLKDPLHHYVHYLYLCFTSNNMSVTD